MSLAYPSPRAFAQSIRLRLAGLPSATSVIAVEGDSDRRTLIRMISESTVLVPARGKEMVLLAREHLEAEERARCTFVIDCDGESSPEWLGHDDLIVTANRDLDADLVLDSAAIETVASEYLATRVESFNELAPHTKNLRAFIVELTSQFGVILDTARRTSLSVRVEDRETGTRRRIRLSDLPQMQDWLISSTVPLLVELAAIVGSRLGWSDDEQNALVSSCVEGAAKKCRQHGLPGCIACRARTYSNGHDLVDSAALALSHHAGFVVGPAEVARALRIALSQDSVRSWTLTARLRRRQLLTGLLLLRERW